MFVKMADSMVVRIVQKAKTTSSIWNYFGLKADDNDVPIHEELEKPVCKLCNKSVSAKRSNTTNLHTHLKDNHPDDYAIVQREKTSTGNASSLTQPTLARFSRRMRDMIRSLLVLKKSVVPLLFFLRKICSHFILSRSRASSK